MQFIKCTYSVLNLNRVSNLFYVNIMYCVYCIKLCTFKPLITQYFYVHCTRSYSKLKRDQNIFLGCVTMQRYQLLRSGQGHHPSIYLHIHTSIHPSIRSVPFFIFSSASTVIHHYGKDPRTQ